MKKVLLALLLGCFAFGLCACKPAPLREPVTLDVTNEAVVPLGRGFYDETSYVFGNPLSGFRVTFTGTTLSAEMTSVWCSKAAAVRQPSRFWVIVDGDDASATLMKLDGTDTVVLCKDLSNGKHTVEVRKNSEAFESTMAVHSVTCDGTFLPDENEKHLCVELLGDSITVGYANDKQKGREDGNAGCNVLKSIGWCLAKRLDADVSVHALSGITLCNGMTDVFDNAVCYQNLFYGGEPKKTVRPKPDVVVVNLGTNDIWAYDDDTIVEEYIAFIDRLFKTYGSDVKIVVCEGAMVSALIDATARICNARPSVFYLPLPSCACGHPCAEEDENYARLLYEKISTIFTP